MHGADSVHTDCVAASPATLQVLRSVGLVATAPEKPLADSASANTGTGVDNTTSKRPSARKGLSAAGGGAVSKGTYTATAHQQQGGVETMAL